MLCLACGAEMILVQVVKDTTMLVSGYEHHTWQCSGCSTVEQRMTFTREKTPTQTASVEPTQTVAVEPTQTAPVEPTHPEPPAAMFQSSAWAKALEKLRSFKERATETERQAQFSREWDNLRSVPPPSASSEMKPDEPLRPPTEPIASPAPTEHDEPIAPESKSERARRLR